MSAVVIDGYVWLSSYDDRNNRNQEHSTEYKRLFDGMKEGHVQGFQDGKSKRWLVHKAQADEFLAQRSESSRPAAARKPTSAGPSASQLEAAVIALCEINNGITLMQATLERLTAAVESIATQPKTAQQEVLATMSSNGFHN